MWSKNGTVLLCSGVVWERLHQTYVFSPPPPPLQLVLGGSKFVFSVLGAIFIGVTIATCDVISFFSTSLAGKLVPPFRSIRCKIKTNRLLVTHVFQRSRSFARFRSDFSLAPLVFTLVLACCCECILAELYRPKIAIETHNVSWIIWFQSVYDVRFVYFSDRMSGGAIWLWMFAPLLMR